MSLPADQVEELKRIAAGISACTEGGVTFILLPNFPLPEGCVPNSMDLLLCPSPRDGYESRMFFSQRVQPSNQQALNWNGTTRVAERNWEAFSWKTPAGLRLAQMLAIHLKALR